MSVVFKYIGFGLMFVFLGIIGVGVFLFYIIRSVFRDDEEEERIE